MIATRPMPPETMLDNFGHPAFQPSAELGEWVRACFIEPESRLYNQDHEHLADAKIGFLWTTIENSKQMRRVVGQAELPMYQGNKWQKARQLYQVAQWFGDVPDFIITLDAKYCAQASDAEFCALVEHELYHCAQKAGLFGEPKFHRDGTPDYGIRGHDVEEFVSVVQRYGAGAPDSPVSKLLQAAATGPTVAKIDISSACGTCLLRVA